MKKPNIFNQSFGLFFDICKESILKINILDELQDFLIINVKGCLIVEKNSVLNKLKMKINTINLFACLIQLFVILIIIFPIFLYWIYFEYLNFFTLLIAVALYGVYIFSIVFLDVFLISKLEKNYLYDEKYDINEIAFKLKKIYYYPFHNIGPNEVNDCIEYSKYNISSEELSFIKLDKDFETTLVKNINQLNEDLNKSKLIKEEVQLLNQLNSINLSLSNLHNVSNNIMTNFSSNEYIPNLTIQERQERIYKLKKEIQMKQKIFDDYKIREEKAKKEAEELERKRIEKEKEKQKEIEKSNLENAIKLVHKVQDDTFKQLKDNSYIIKLINNFIEKCIFNKSYSFPIIIKLCKLATSNIDIKLEGVDEATILKQEMLNLNIERYLTDFNMLFKVIDNDFRTEVINNISNQNVPYHILKIENKELYNISIYKFAIIKLIIYISLEKLSKVFETRFHSLLEKYDTVDDLINEIIKLPSLNPNDNVYLLFGYCSQKNIDNLFSEYQNFMIKVNKARELYNKQQKIEKFKSKLLADDTIRYYSMSDIDAMTGLEFEYFLRKLFIEMGFKCNITQATQDQGLDLIIEKDNQKIGVQAKCYNSASIGNKAIQEVIAGIQYYNCSQGMVITNSYFTKQAIDLSEKANIILYDRDKLTSLLVKYPVKK